MHRLTVDDLDRLIDEKIILLSLSHVLDLGEQGRKTPYDLTATTQWWTLRIAIDLFENC